MEWTELDIAAPGPGEVRLAQRAVGVNFIDTYFRSGLYPWPSTPLIPGAEAAGVVEDVGAGVTGFRAGDRVAYALPLGAYRTRRVVPADRLVRLPDAITFETAASVMLKGLTVHFLLTSCFAVQRGHTVLVHAAAGGVGLLLTQMVKMRGGIVIGTASTTAKAILAQQAGADHLAGYDDFAAVTGQVTDGAGAAAVYDGVGLTTFDDSLSALRPRGYMVLYGAASGPVPAFELQRLAAGGSLYITRPTLGSYLASRDELLSRTADLFSWIGQGKLSVRVGGTYPLGEAARAHEDLGGRRTTGKLILLP
jgi:NADPH2:quinone reductase